MSPLSSALALSCVVTAFILVLSEPLFRDIFGHGRGKAGMSPDHLLLTFVIFAGTLIAPIRLLLRLISRKGVFLKPERSYISSEPKPW